MVTKRKGERDYAEKGQQVHRHVALRLFTIVGMGLIAIIGTGGGSSGGGDDGGDIEPQTYTASGTYVYDQGTGILIATFTSSEFPEDCGPSVGIETHDVNSLTETTMVWDEGEEYVLTWARDSGTAGDITGTWDFVDEGGNAFEVNINADGTMTVIGEIVDCGDGGGGQSDTITGESGNQVSLDGIWNGTCVSDLDDGSSEIEQLTISGLTFTMTITEWFSSIACEASPDVTQTIGGSITLGNEVTATLNSSNVTATRVDVAFSSGQATILNPAVVGDINAEQACGFNDWAVGVTKDISGTSCMPGTQKDILYVDDVAEPDVLYFGDEEGTLDAGYPTTIDLGSMKDRM